MAESIIYPILPPTPAMRNINRRIEAPTGNSKITHYEIPTLLSPRCVGSFVMGSLGAPRRRLACHRGRASRRPEKAFEIDVTSFVLASVLASCSAGQDARLYGRPEAWPEARRY